MGWDINCTGCGEKSSYARDIVDLIDNHTDSFFQDGGFIKCTNCQGRAFIYDPRELQEGAIWERYVRAVIRIKSNEYDFLNHYAYLTSNTKDGEIDGVEICYYKDLRPVGGRLKHGHGPGGPPALAKSEILSFIGQLKKIGWT